MRGIREGDGGGFAGIPLDDIAWIGKGRSVELGSLGHGRRPADVLSGLPNQGRTKELPCGGLPSKGWDTDSNADAFLQPACPGHRDHFGRGKPPTPKVLTMLHAGPMAGTKRQVPRHHNVQERGGAEEKTDGGGRVAGQHVEGLRGLRETTRDGSNVQISGAGNDSGR